MTPSLDLLSFLLTLAAIVLSLVALLVTVLGFFASLKFYRDGMETQQAVSRLLAKVESKIDSISTQVGGLFETTLKAALNRPGEQVQSQTRELAPQADPNNPISLLAEEIREGKSPGATVEKLLTVRSLHFTNVSDPIGNLFFSMGRDLAFNVFDAANRIWYYGHFYKLGGEDIVRRVRILVGRLHDNLLKIINIPEDPRRDHLISLFRNARIVVLVPDASDERVAAKIAEFQPEDWQVPVTALTPEGLERALSEEYERMKP